LQTDKSEREKKKKKGRPLTQKGTVGLGFGHFKEREKKEKRREEACA
jgi:hypothetical protein